MSPSGWIYSQTTAPMIDSSAFPGMPSPWFLSASRGSSYVQVVDFRNGRTEISRSSENVRCVR
jgi:hypothetical protein